MSSKSITKEQDDDPVHNLEDQTTDSYGSIVFTCIDATKLVFDDRYQGSQKQISGDMAMDEVTPDDDWEQLC